VPDDTSGEFSPPKVIEMRRLLHALRTLRLQQLVFSSSPLAMRPARPGARHDSSATAAAHAYLEAEKVLREERGGVPVVIGRVAGVYDEDFQSLSLAHQIRCIYEKRLESFVFPGDADHGQPFLHLEDAARCTRIELAPFEVFLIAEAEVMSQHEFQETLGQLLHGKAWPTVRLSSAAGEAETSTKNIIRSWVSLADHSTHIRKLQQRLGCKPAHLLRDALPEIVARLKRDPDRWYETNGLTAEDESTEQFSCMLVG
jgi:nucleoside-diphosphate-sugar epimerase